MAPCKDCNKHSETCHSVCPAYKEYRAKRDEILEKKKKIGEVTYALNSIQWQKIKKLRHSC